MTDARQHSSTGPFVGGVVVAAVYIYFLIFAQFAFLKLLQADGLGVQEIRFVMGAMGVAGVVASLGSARLFREAYARRLLIAGFAVCGITAALSLGGHGLWARCMISALIGLGLGTTTVALAASAPLFFPVTHRGAQIGLGTGLAYAFCNIPPVFSGTPELQTCLAIGACAVGILGLFSIRLETPLESDFVAPPHTQPSARFPALVAAFLALVWLDSAAFYILQSTPELNRFGWASATLQWRNAAIHLTAACIGGFWLDRGRMNPLLFAAFGSLAIAAVLVSLPHAFGVQSMHWFYAAGVSLYSTALVFAPSATGHNRTFAAAARRAGGLYAVAGWSGSALGIGMAQDLHRIPLWFLGVSGVVLAGGLLYRKLKS